MAHIPPDDSSSHLTDTEKRWARYSLTPETELNAAFQDTQVSQGDLITALRTATTPPQIAEALDNLRQATELENALAVSGLFPPGQPLDMRQLLQDERLLAIPHVDRLTLPLDQRDAMYGRLMHDMEWYDLHNAAMGELLASALMQFIQENGQGTFGIGEFGTGTGHHWIEMFERSHLRAYIERFMQVVSFDLLRGNVVSQAAVLQSILRPHVGIHSGQVDFNGQMPDVAAFRHKLAAIISGLTLIYLEKEGVENFLRAVVEALLPGGFLVCSGQMHPEDPANGVFTLGGYLGSEEGARDRIALAQRPLHGMHAQHFVGENFSRHTLPRGVAPIIEEARKVGLEVLAVRHIIARNGFALLAQYRP